MGRCKETGRFTKGNQAAVGNRGNRNPKWGNKNAFKHGLYGVQCLAKIREDGNLQIQIGSGRGGVSVYRLPPSLFRKDENGLIWVHDSVADQLESVGVRLEHASNPESKKT